MDDSNMSMFDLSINDLWESSYHIFFYTYVVIWILVAYRTHAKSNQAGKLFSGLGTVIFFWVHRIFHASPSRGLVKG